MNKELSKNELTYLRKLKQKKYRDSESAFIIEGKHLIEECLKSGFYNKNIQYVVVSKDFSDSYILKILNRKKIQIQYSSEKNISSLSETETPQGIIALVRKRNREPEVKYNCDVTVLLDRISDPGNLGTILRTCWWFDVRNVFLSSGCADIYNSKTVRASQGAIFNLNIYVNSDIPEELVTLSEKKFKIFLTTSHNAEEITNYNLKRSGKTAFVFGNEASGIDKRILENCNYKKIKIKSFTECESLNVSSAAAVILGYYRLN